MIDRTEEFLSLQAPSTGASSHGEGRATSQPQLQAEPSGKKTAKDERFKIGTNFVSRELQAIEHQIGLFVRETKSRSLYEDSGAAIAAGTEKIKSKLDVLSKTISQLSSFVQGAVASKQQREHRVLVVNTLKKQFAKLTKEFKDNLQKRTNALTSRQARQMKQFGASTVQLTARTKASVFNPAQSRFGKKPGQSNGNASTQDRNTNKPFIAPVPPPAPTYAMHASTPVTGAGVRRRVGLNDGNSSSMSPQMQMQQGEGDMYDNDKLHRPQLQMYDRSHKQARRAVHVKQAESLISELSTMLGEVATMVVEQGEDVELIDGNLEETRRHVTIGNTELLKYYNNLSKERQLILKILAVVLALGIVFLIMFRR